MVISPFWYLFKPRKVGWSGSRGLLEGGGGDCQKYLKRAWNRKQGRGNKDFKKGRQAGSMGGCLKKRGTGTPLRTMGKGRWFISGCEWDTGWVFSYFFIVFVLQFLDVITLVLLNRYTRAWVLLCLFLCPCVVFFVFGPFN